MWNYQKDRLFIVSTVLSSVFSLFIIILTVYHHLTVQRALKDLTDIERYRDDP